MFTKTLIIDSRKELSVKYKKIIENKTNDVTIINNVALAFNFIQQNEPDLIILSDSINEDFCKLCEKIRILTFNSRPIIIAISKSAETSDRIKMLECGADDFISEPISTEEFKIKIKAHIRREYETNLDAKTKLPALKYSQKALKRIITSNMEWACLYVGIENFFSYKESYTEIASDRLLQTFSAIINSVLDENDYIGMTSDRDFLIITNSNKAEKIASFITFAFESVKNKFYSEQDLERGYMMVRSNDFTEKRKEFVYAVTSGITKATKKFNSEYDILHELKQVYNIAKNKKISSYLIERPQISGKNSVVEETFNNKIVIIEQDSALSLLLTTTLGLKGYLTQEYKTLEEIENYNPALIILDTGIDKSKSDINICSEIKNFNSKIKVIVTSIYHEKEEILKAGADIYLPKPYNINTMINWVDSAVKEYNYI